MENVKQLNRDGMSKQWYWLGDRNSFYPLNIVLQYAKDCCFWKCVGVWDLA